MTQTYDRLKSLKSTGSLYKPFDKNLWFKHNRFKQKNHKYKEIGLKKANSEFIVVRHPLPTSTLLKLLTKWGFHYTWSFNQASNTFTAGFWLKWALTQSLQVSSHLKLLTLTKILKYKFKLLNLAQQKLKYNSKAMKNHKGALRNMKMEI